MKVLNKIILALLVVVFASVLFSPMAQADVMYWGGLDIMLIPCTCEAGVLIWNYFTPLYYNSGVMISGPLLYNFAAPMLYNYHVMFPSVWGLGHFYVGPQCLLGFPPYCYPLYSYGTIDPRTGGSL